MNGLNMNEPSQTDWARIEAMTDEQIDTSDIPPLTEAFFAKAKVRMPLVTLTIQMEPTMLEWYKMQGEDYQQRMLAALRIYMEAHKAKPHRVMTVA